jgi:hypothetical protein
LRPRKPPKPVVWNVYKIASKAVWLDAFEPDEASAKEKTANLFPVAGRWRRQVTAEFKEAAGGEAMTRRKSEITHDDLKRKRKTDVISVEAWAGLQRVFCTDRPGYSGARTRSTC